MTTKGRQGFASMDPAKRREICSKGGKLAHAMGRAHRFTPDEARAAGRIGGASTSRNRAHMAEIGRKGGATVSRDREHMARIGAAGAAKANRKAI